MTNEFNYGYQYDRCVSRGICSINPTTASLLEVILLYLKAAAFYGLEFEKQGIFEKTIRNLVLNTVSILSSGYEISKDNFGIINSAFQKELPVIIEKYENSFRKIDNFGIKELLKTQFDLNYYIRLGEKAFNKRTNSISGEIRNLYKIIFLLIKSFCINILTYESYGRELHEEVISVFKIFNLLNEDTKNKDELKDIIKDIAKKDCDLMLKIREAQENEYGVQSEQEVSFSTQKGKSVLVVGSNLKELELILDKLNGENIDVYTHDNMILAHTFPKFKQYSYLKGQFGQGMENCLLDFSTFPGPIIITRNSLYNVENLYRGILYTTDFAYSKGVIPIKNNDFSDVIKSAKNSSGFKTGKKCASEQVGFNYNKSMETIFNRLSEKKYSKIFIIGIEGYSTEEKEYFKNLLKHAPEDVLIVSFSCCVSKNNVICLNSTPDNYSFLKLSNEIISQADIDISIFVPNCNRHLLSVIVNLTSQKKIKLFAGSWNQTVITPNIMSELKENFNIYQITTAKQDLAKIQTSK